jgi:hypothetical protein
LGLPRETQRQFDGGKRIYPEPDGGTRVFLLFDRAALLEEILSELK